MFSLEQVSSPVEAYKLVSEFLEKHLIEAPTAQQVEHLFGLAEADLAGLLRTKLPAVFEGYAQRFEGKDYKLAKRKLKIGESLEGHVMFPFPASRLEAYNEALRLLPADRVAAVANCYARRAEMLLQKGDYVESLTNSDRALRLHPTMRKAFLVRAEALFKLGQVKAATDYLEKAADFLAKDDKDGEFKERVEKIKNQIKRHEKHRKYEEKSLPEEKPCLKHNLRLHDGCTVDRRSAENSTYVLKAQQYIPKDSVLFEESPAVIVHKGQFVYEHCAECGRECANTFVPCDNCSEAVFCSENCFANTQNDDSIHGNECAFAAFLADKVGPHGQQVYRAISRQGLEFYFKSCVDNVNSVENDLPYIISNLSRLAIPSRKLALENYGFAQVANRARYLKFYPNRSKTEMTNAIILLGLIIHKFGASIPSVETLKTLLHFISVDIAKARSFEFAFTVSRKSAGGKSEKIPCAAYQTVLAASLAPSCEPNATWEFNGTSFVASAARDIQVGEEICITYGSYEHFIERQRGIAIFSALCSCEKCIHEVSNHFALKCFRCAGPIPFSPKVFENRVCMACNEVSEVVDAQYGRRTSAQFETVTALVRMYTSFGVRFKPEWILNLDSALSKLYESVFVHSAQLLKMTQSLAVTHYKNNLPALAASWFQWMKDNFNIDLSLVSDDKSELGLFEVQRLFASCLFNQALIRSNLHYYISGCELLDRLQQQIDSEGLFGEATSDTLESIKSLAGRWMEQLNEQKQIVRTQLIQEGKLEENVAPEPREPSEELPSEQSSVSGRESNTSQEFEFEITQPEPSVSFLNSVPSLVSDSFSVSESQTPNEPSELSAEVNETQDSDKSEPSVLETETAVSGKDKKKIIDELLSETESFTNESSRQDSESLKNEHSRSTIGGTESDDSELSDYSDMD